jgi:adenosylcobinamide-GDP ribazoletransferase
VLRADLLAAFMLLTRLPVGRFARQGGRFDLGRCVWAFPVVGFTVGAIGACLYWLLHRAGVAPLLAAAWTLAGTLAATGALHEDALTDTADGFGGGATRARKLEIMRDSRIGSYGALALLLSVIIRVAALAQLGAPARVAAAMIASAILGRSGMLVLLLVLSPARTDGMGASVGRPGGWTAVVGLGLAGLVPLLVLPFIPGVTVVIFALGCSLAVTKLAAGQIGGYTGDVLGACEVGVECVVMTVLASSFGT